ncbi:MAG TPA: twin-arginine translocase subunit TatC [Phycisphaerales bacterium]|nr:twin-arginine translocase subunit TatC [Phycisphaerales bacterium]HMP38172.1 twin-arginine translocase subunit TatC [Phycisphaerales bacterium]
MAKRHTDDDRTGQVMSFGDHLDELRRRLILALVAPLPVAIAIFLVAEPIRRFLCRPLVEALRANRLPTQLQTLHPVETLMLDLKLAIILGLVVAGPWIFWQAWLFVAPGLYRHERRFVRFLLPASAVLMVSGLALLYFVILPLMLTMLVSFGVTKDGDELPRPRPIDALEARVEEATPPADQAAPPNGLGPLLIPTLAVHPAEPMPGQAWIKVPENLLCVALERDGMVEVLASTLGRGTLVVQQYRLSEYINFVLVMTAGVALGFQLPLVILLLGWLDILRLETLRSNRKYALMACAVIAAVITPPDIVSMGLTLVPLYLLYELGVLLLAYLPAWRVLGLDPPRAAPAPVAAGGTVRRGDAIDQAGGP